MGRRNGHYMSFYKDAMGWLNPENKTTVTSSRQVRLHPIEQPSTGLQSVLVPRGDNTQFHLEFRRALGFDSFLETGLTNGVLLRYMPSGNGLPHLVNFGSQNAATDASLKPNNTFTDGTRQIRVVEANAESALVDIIIDGMPPGGAGGMAGTAGTGGGGAAGRGGVGGTGGPMGGMGNMGGVSGAGAVAGAAGTATGGMGGSGAGGAAAGASSGGTAGTAGGLGGGAVGAAGTGAAGTGGSSGGSTGTSAGTSSGAGASGTGTSGTPTGAPASTNDDAGCGCRTVSQRASGFEANAALAFGLVLLLRLRRRMEPRISKRTT
jgi:MYXO-CTERM domain-containing protein